MRHLIVPALALLPALLFGGCKREGGHEQHKDHSSMATPAPVAAPVGGPVIAGIVNAKCPISGKPVDPAVTVDFEGRKVAFCCKDCIADWNKLDTEGKRAKLKT